jgi:hypothetical protein
MKFIYPHMKALNDVGRNSAPWEGASETTRIVQKINVEINVERPRDGSPITRLLSYRPVLRAEELLILLINFMK